MFYRKYYHIINYGKYGIATTKLKFPKKKFDKIYYEFRAENGINYSGTYNQNKSVGLKNKVKYPKGKYLVIYSTEDPTINVLVESREVDSKLNLDSLNKHGVDSKEWSWKDL